MLASNPPNGLGNPLEGLTAKDVRILEIFFGTAGVTAAFKCAGFDNSINSIAVDKQCSPGLGASVIPMDLTKMEDQEAIKDCVKHAAVKGVS